MTRVELAEKVAKALDVSNHKADLIVATVLEGMRCGLAADGRVTLRGFGGFHVRQKKERNGRNPQTGEPAIISARKVVKFKASGALKELVNN